MGTTTAIVHVRVDERVKKRASKALDLMGLSISDLVRMLLVRVAEEKRVPFEIRVPNAETIEAIEEARAGNLESFDSVGKMLESLNAAA